MSNNLRTAVHTLQVVRDGKTVEIAPGTVDDFGQDTEAFDAAGAVREPTEAELAVYGTVAEAAKSAPVAARAGRPSNAAKEAAEAAAAKEAEEAEAANKANADPALG